jgi:hypothetical protein
MASHLLRLPSAWLSFMNTGCQVRVRDLLARHRDSSGSARPQPFTQLLPHAWSGAVPRAQGQASSFPRRRATPGLRSSCPFACAEGIARRKAQTLVCASVTVHGGRLWARHRRVCSTVKRMTPYMSTLLRWTEVSSSTSRARMKVSRA